MDDEADTRELLRTILAQCGAEVTVVTTAREALEALERAPFGEVRLEAPVVVAHRIDEHRSEHVAERGMSGVAQLTSPAVATRPAREHRRSMCPPRRSHATHREP